VSPIRTQGFSYVSSPQGVQQSRLAGFQLEFLNPGIQDERSVAGGLLMRCLTYVVDVGL